MFYSCWLLLPIGALLISCISIFACLYWLRRRLSSMEFPAPIKDSPSKYWEDAQMDQKIELLIQKHVQGLVDLFKSQIPMIAMFISKAREDKLKDQACAEFVKIIPEIKEQVTAYEGSHGSSSVVQEQLVIRSSENAKSLFDKLWKEALYSILTAACVLGLILGFIEAGLFYLFC